MGKASIGIIRIIVLEMKGILVVYVTHDLQWLTINRDLYTLKLLTQSEKVKGDRARQREKNKPKPQLF